MRGLKPAITYYYINRQTLPSHRLFSLCTLRLLPYISIVQWLIISPVISFIFRIPQDETVFCSMRQRHCSSGVSASDRSYIDRLIDNVRRSPVWCSLVPDLRRFFLGLDCFLVAQPRILFLRHFAVKKIHLYCVISVG